MGLKDIRGRRAPELREYVTRDGSVLKCPRGDTRNVSAKDWEEFYAAHVAAPYDEEDPYAREVGGGDA